MENVRIYNTLTKKVERFVPAESGKIRFFVCGPTVYDFPHLGHAKTYTQFDGMVKFLRWCGYEVTYLQNITDIDDKIIQRASEKGESFDTLARRFEDIYREDMQALHNTAVTTYARATEYIDQIVSQVQRLMDKGCAYRTGDGIYFEIAKFPDYGKLSGRMEVQKDDAVSRIDTSTEKRGWNDFCLWKFSKEGEPSWDTALGKGRPGWHIEDTAITEKYFGAQYDIHGGAVDLIFPHHEAEIAQMESISGKKPFVQVWMHSGFLNINSQKMSKSLGNFKTLRDTLKQYDYRVLRYLFLSAHYRTAIDFTDSVLEQSKNALTRIDEFIFRIDPAYDDTDDETFIQKTRAGFIEPLCEDFNTPKAFAALFDFIRTQNLKKKVGKRTLAFLQDINFFLDIFQFDSQESDTVVDSLILQREQARKKKDFIAADKIRDQLIALGVKIYDTENGTQYRKP